MPRPVLAVPAVFDGILPIGNRLYQSITTKLGALMPESTLMRVPDVAKYLAVSEAWVRMHTADNSLKCVRVGRNIRYRLEDIENYLNREFVND